MVLSLPSDCTKMSTEYRNQDTYVFLSYRFNRLSCIGFLFAGFQQNSSCATEFYDENHFQLIIPDEVFLANVKKKNIKMNSQFFPAEYNEKSRVFINWFVVTTHFYLGTQLYCCKPDNTLFVCIDIH